jgi:hypothetical protein
MAENEGEWRVANSEWFFWSANREVGKSAGRK